MKSLLRLTIPYLSNMVLKHIRSVCKNVLGTFENLLLAVSQVQEKLARIEQLLLGMGEKNEDANNWLDINQLLNYLPDKSTKPTVYNWIRTGKIPTTKVLKSQGFKSIRLVNG